MCNRIILWVGRARRKFIISFVFFALISSPPSHASFDPKVLIGCSRVNFLFAVDYLLYQGFDPNFCTFEGETALKVAAARGHSVVIDHLINRGAVLEDSNENFMYGATALFVAIKFGHEQVARQLIEKGASLSVKTLNGETLLHALMGSPTFGDEASVERFVDLLMTAEHSSLEEVDSMGNTPLHTAVDAKNLIGIKVLIKKKVNVNLLNLWGDTPLLLACRESSFDLVSVLLQARARVDDVNRDGDSPLILSARRRDRQSVQALLEGGAPRDHRNNSGEDAYIVALIENDLDILQLLLSYAVNPKGSGRNSPLNVLLANSPPLNKKRDVKKGIGILIENGVSPSSIDEDGNTALHVAAQFGNVEGVETLLKVEQALELLGSVNKAGHTPLVEASHQGRVEIVKLLLKAGAPIDLMGGEMELAIRLAESNGNTEIVRLLEERQHSLQDEWR